MTAAGLPVFIVELDDGTNTFPHAVTAHVRLEMGWQVTRGRQDRFADVQPGTLDIVFDNTAGLFTLGSGTYDIAINQRIRFGVIPGGASVPYRFTGRVQVWPTEWPDGGETFSVARVRAVDDSARFERRKLRTLMQEQLLSHTPALYYPLNDPADSSPSPLTDEYVIGRLVQRGPSTAVVLGTTGYGPRTDGQGVPVFSYDGKYLQAEKPIDPSTLMLGAFGCVFEVVALTPSLSEFALITMYPKSGSGGVVVRADPTAETVTLFLDDTSGGVSTVTGAVPGLATGPHWVEVVAQELFVDDVSLGTAAGTFGGTFADEVWLDVGGYISGTAGDKWSISHVTLGISPFGSPNTYDCVKDGGPTGDDTRDRLIRIIEDYVGETGVASVTGLAQDSVPFVDWVGSSAGEAIRAVARGEGGVFFIRGDGQCVIQSRYHRALQETPEVSFDVDEVGPDTSVVTDLQGVINHAAYTGVTGGEQVCLDAVSNVTHGQYPDSQTLLVADGDAALAAAHWVVNTSAEPAPKLPQVTVDLITQDAAFQEAVMDLEISDRIALTGMPAQADSTTYDLIVEGWVESGDHTSWQIVFNTSNWEQARAWILGDAVYGVLGSTTRLGY